MTGASEQAPTQLPLQKHLFKAQNLGLAKQNNCTEKPFGGEKGVNKNWAQSSGLRPTLLKGKVR